MQPQCKRSIDLARSLQVFDTKLQQKHPHVTRYLINMYGQPQALLLLKQHVKPPAKSAHHVAANGNGALGPEADPLAPIMHLMEQPWTGEHCVGLSVHMSPSFLTHHPHHAPVCGGGRVNSAARRAPAHGARFRWPGQMFAGMLCALCVRRSSH